MLALTLAAGAPGRAADLAPSAPDIPGGELDLVRQEGIRIVGATQQREATLTEITHERDLLVREAAGRQRGLDETRTEQEQLLGILEHLARNPGDDGAAVHQASIDRQRGEMLLAAVVPELRAEAHALSAEIEALEQLRTRIAAKESEIAAARESLARQRDQLARIAARRAELCRQLLHPETDEPTATDSLGQQAGDLAELVKRADDEADKLDKALLARARKRKAGEAKLAAADPTRPASLRTGQLAIDAMFPPVSGTIVRRYGEKEGSEAANQGLSVSTAPAAAVGAPVDGQVIYAGPFGSYGLVLIMRHGDGYHSVLAGLGRTDASAGQWVLAGEPLGVMPEPAETSSGGTLYFELRREGRPVDPQPWLATRDEVTRRGDRAGDQRVRE